jgi:hypothetical protein
MTDKDGMPELNHIRHVVRSATLTRQTKESATHTNVSNSIAAERVAAITLLLPLKIGQNVICISLFNKQYGSARANTS